VDSSNGVNKNTLISLPNFDYFYSDVSETIKRLDGNFYIHYDSNCCGNMTLLEHSISKTEIVNPFLVELSGVKYKYMITENDNGLFFIRFIDKEIQCVYLLKDGKFSIHNNPEHRTGISSQTYKTLNIAKKLYKQLNTSYYPV